VFDDLLRELKRLEQGTLIPIQLPLDSDGYMDRACSSETCGTEFKILFEDWKEKVTNEAVFCPICRYEAPATKWNTRDQAEYIRAIGSQFIAGKVQAGLRRSAEAFNRRQRPGFISLRMSYKPGPERIILPIAAADAMRQNHSCESCGCRYASIGAAFFCPACGVSSTEKMLQTAIESARGVVAVAPGMRHSFDADTAENTIRHMLESTLSSLIGAFQHYAEALYQKTGSQVKPRKNVFQNLSESSKLWKDATGTSYEDLLSVDEMKDLVRLFQQRHLIVHRNGLVDTEYLTRSGDTSYAVGQRIVVTGQAVLLLAALITKLAGGLRGLTAPRT
jgi:uncharacterized Zn finger protein (UPF0148 family)